MKNTEILEGFIPWNFNLYGYMWEGFGWYGELQMLFRGKSIVVSASGFPKGDNGDMKFKIYDNYTQAECDEMEIIAFKTNNPSNLHPNLNFYEKN